MTRTAHPRVSVSAPRGARTARSGVRAADRNAVPTPAELFEATSEVRVVTVPARTVVSIEGHGAPEGTEFQHGVAAVFGIAYTLKFSRKHTEGTDFKVGPLEVRWWTESPSGTIRNAPRETWCWRLRLAVPSDVSAKEVASAIADATTKKHGKLSGSAAAKRVVCERVRAQRVAQTLHVGPYAAEQTSFERIFHAIDRLGFTPGKAHIEVYLNDPKRTKPERLKTVILVELEG
jgi:hypothetical protein